MKVGIELLAGAGAERTPPAADRAAATPRPEGRETTMMAELASYFELRREELLADIRELVESESPSLDARAATALAAELVVRFEELGATVHFHPTGAGTHLVATKSFGIADASPPILLLGHLDTVWPLGTLARRPFRVEDGRAYGPGIFDMKSGVALMVAALRAIRDLGLRPHRSLRILLTCDEESGSPTSRDLIRSEAAGCGAVFVLEPSLPGGAAKTERKGFATYELIARGVSAHAGLDPEKGVSATLELAHQVLALDRLNDPGRGISVNVGVVRGGTGVNVVAEEARAELDVRFRSMAEVPELLRRIESLQPVLNGARLEVRGGLNRPPMERTPAIAALFEWARSIAGELGFELGEGPSGGASDGNFTAALGVPTLDGLGVEGDGAHAAHEHILVADLPRRAALLTALLVRFGACFGALAVASAEFASLLAGSC